MSNLVLAQATKLAQALGVDGDGRDLIETLKATAFKGQVSDSQMAALLIVANQYGLSPWTKEIYAFPDRNNGIVPVVGVDGWSRIINSHPEFDGMDFEQDDEGCTCRIHRKDRKHPICVTEFMAECRREGVGPWKSHPRRMLRHKAMIQCARLAFGYGGIYDQDEAERIIDSDTGEIKPVQKPAPVAAPELVTAAEAAAARGVQAYQQFWEEAGPVNRKALGGHHERLKAAATTADARTVDVEPRNSPEQEGAE